MLTSTGLARTIRLSPTALLAMLLLADIGQAGAAQIQAGDYHTCALVDTGGVMCWGRNFEGQLGNGTWAHASTPVDVTGLVSGVAGIAAGYYHTCVVTVAGGVKCWGRNGGGDLGDGTNTNRNAPVDVSGLGSGVTAITAGGHHTCALTAGGGAKCWGANAQGQIGMGSITGSIIVPVDVAGLTSRVAKIEAGGYHSCAITNFNVAKCWGGNMYGGLGNGLTADSPLPVNVRDLPLVATPTNILPVLMLLLK